MPEVPPEHEDLWIAEVLEMSLDAYRATSIYDIARLLGAAQGRALAQWVRANPRGV